MRVLIINGPNLNMLGRRDKEHYGSRTLIEINDSLKEYSSFPIDFYQSNHEGEIIDKIQSAIDYDALIINPGAYTHTSIAIRDALEILKITKIEVHLSNIYAREDFRKVNYIHDVVDYSIVGEGEKGYFYAIDYLKKHFNMV